jgi:hypothetical protein
MCQAVSFNCAVCHSRKASLFIGHTSPARGVSFTSDLAYDLGNCYALAHYSGPIRSVSRASQYFHRLMFSAFG